MIAYRIALNVYLALFLIAGAVFFAMPPREVNAVPSTYYVSKAGNDTNPGTEANPWLTIQKAADTMVGGDIAYVKTGNYTEQVVFPTSGNSTAGYITFKNYGSDVVYVDGTGLSLGSSTSGSVQGLFYIHAKNYIWVEGFRILNSSCFGLSIYENSDHITAKNLEIYDTGGSGVFVSSTWNSATLHPTNITLDGLTIHDTNSDEDMEVISLRQVSDFEIKNSTLHDVLDSDFNGRMAMGIAGSTNGLIHHNEVYNTYSGITVGGRAGDLVAASNNVSIYNNYIHDVNYDAGLCVGSESTTAAGTSYWYNNIVANSAIGFLSDNYGGPFTRTFNLINNTFYHNDNEILIKGTATAYNVNCSIRNNIVIGMNASSLLIQYDEYANGGVMIDHNLFYDAAGYSASNKYGTSYVQADPLLNVYDYSIAASSPAKDVGSSTGAPNTDYAGTARPQGDGYDIGAYEYPVGSGAATGIPNPDVAPTLERMRVYRNLLETGDSLYIWEANIPYATPPDYKISEAFVWSMVGNSTILGSTGGYAYHEDGYNHNIYGLYFTSASALTWGTAYTLMLNGNPALFTSAPVYNFAVNVTDYTAETTTAANKAALATEVLWLAEDLNSKWALTTTTTLTENPGTGTVLSLAGETVFRGSISGIQSMAPAAFATTTTDINAPDRTWNTTYVTTLDSQWNGTWIEVAKNASISIMGTGYDLPSLIILFGICGVVVLANIMVTAGDHWNAIIDVAFVATVATRMGILGLVVLGLIASICVFYIGTKLWRMIPT